MSTWRALRSFLLALVSASGLAGCSRTAPENLVIVSLDTVRRDHLPVYGYSRNTAPALSELARRSLVFENAFSQAVVTAPSHGSMFTGLYPHQHGATCNGCPLDRGVPTLAAILRDSGFRTAAFVSGYTMRRKPSGLERGFEHYDDELTGRRDGGATVTRALRWLSELEAGERYFLFVHLYDAHGPYHAPASYRPLFTSPTLGPRLERIPDYQRFGFPRGRVPEHLNPYVDRYDAAIRYMDDLLARILERVDLERTALVVLSDHGETLAERYHVLDHGTQLFEEQIRIPLVLFAPGIEAGRIGATVETVDLPPTLLALLRIPGSLDAASQGRSWIPLLEQKAGADADDRLVFSSARCEPERYPIEGFAFDIDRRVHAVRSARWKLIRYPGHEHDLLALYDLESDPRETRDLAARETEVRDELARRLSAWLGDAPAAGRPELSPEDRERLRELGYITD